jgi:NAD(P)-dependent dehydrogenase (short-subunit alcohol dehydrogenase family)
MKPDNLAEMWSLSGRTAMVTGASSGLGWHFAQTLAGARARVLVAARRVDRLQLLVSELLTRHAEAYAVALDVTNAFGVRKAFDMAAEHGFEPDIIVNCAGVTTFKPALEVMEEEWDAVTDTNLKGSWLVAREAAARMVAQQRSGSIVNVASILGLRTGGGLVAYGASKAGLVHMTRLLALEWARHKIRVNAIAPGYFVTDLNRDFLGSELGERARLRIPQRRFGSPEHLDGPLLLLASEAGAYITGAVIAVDGGHLCSSL